MLLSFLWCSTKFPESSFQEKISATAFGLHNLVKRVVFCYLRDIVGEFPLGRKNYGDNNNNNNNNNDDQIKKFPCLRSCQQIKFFVSAEVCNTYLTPFP